jgi:hypothetical protein
MVSYEVVDDHDPAATEGVVRVAALGDIHAAVDSPGVHARRSPSFRARPTSF